LLWPNGTDEPLALVPTGRLHFSMTHWPPSIPLGKRQFRMHLSNRRGKDAAAARSPEVAASLDIASTRSLPGQADRNVYPNYRIRPKRRHQRQPTRENLCAQFALAFDQGDPAATTSVHTD
jgi:hypothetical protein